MTSDPRVLRLTLLAAVLGSSIVFLDSSVVNVALPKIRSDLDADLAIQQWIVESYALTLAALLLVGGSLGDLFGRRRVFVLGLIGFGITSVLCALAPTGVTLVLARGLQGIAGAALVPGSLALLTAIYPEDQRGAAIGSWTAFTGVAQVVGPLGGGLIVDNASWRWIFLINVPLVIGCIMLVRAGVPESEDDDEDFVRKVDVVGAVLGALGLAGPVLALIEQPSHGWTSGIVLFPLIAGLALLGAFLWWEDRTDHPMLPLGLFKSRNFAVGNLTTLTVYAGLGAAIFFVSLFLQQVAGYDPIASGLSLLPTTVVMFLLARRFGALSQTIGPRVLMGFGPMLAGLGLILMGQLDSDVSYFTDLLPGVLVFSLGLSMTVAPLTSTVLAAVSDHHAGVASGTNNAISRVASLLSIAAIGAIVASAFTGSLADVHPATGQGERALSDVRGRALSGSVDSKRFTVEPVEAKLLNQHVTDASVHAYHVGLGVAGGLVMFGGLVSLVGIANPPRKALEAPAGQAADAVAS